MILENDILFNLYSAFEHNPEKNPGALKYWAEYLFLVYAAF